MKKVYYITDGVVFNNDAELVKALTKGATIVNDDADLEFKVKGTRLEITHRFTDEKAVVKPVSWNVSSIIELMDDTVARAQNEKKWNTVVEMIYNKW